MGQRAIFTDDLANGLRSFGFDVLKTKARFWPDFTKDGRDHILVEILYPDVTYEVRKELGLGPSVTLSTMHGKWGCTPISIPFAEASFDRLKKELRKVKRQKENDLPPCHKDLRWLLGKVDWV